MAALAKRRSAREFTPDALPMQLLSDLLWAAYGVNRDDGGRTAPSALNCQEVEVFVALPAGAYRYDAAAQRESYASAAAGAIAQNVYLFCASNDLATVIRAWIDRAAIADALGLTHDQQVLLAQTVGYPQT